MWTQGKLLLAPKSYGLSKLFIRTFYRFQPRAQIESQSDSPSVCSERAVPKYILRLATKLF